MGTQTAATEYTVTREKGQELLRQMMRIRLFENKSAEMYSAMKIRGFLHLYNGEEAVAVGVMQALQPQDNIVATYREHGQALARGISMNSIMAELYGKVEGCSMGRGGSMHIFDKATNFYGGNAIVGGGLPLSVGLAQAAKMQKKPSVTCCFFGDGAVAEGEFHEALNLAVLWKLPVLFLCENNLYGMGTALQYSESVTDIASKAASYGMPAEVVDGMDVLAVEDAAQRAVDAVRAGEGPYFLECRTYRFRAHSMFDAELYRDKAEVEEWRQRDPIKLLREHLEANDLITADEITRMQSEIDEEIAAAVDFAEAGTWEPVEDLTRFVCSEKGGA